MKGFVGAAVLALVTASAAWSAIGAESTLSDADLAWDRGDYPQALQAYLALLDASPTDGVVDAIALQTGELFRTIELTADGGAPRFSPDGTYVAYEIGRGITRKTRLARTDSPTVTVADLPGYGASFAPDGAAVSYLKLTVTREMQDLEHQLDQAVSEERAGPRAALAALTETAARITIRQLDNGAERDLETGSLRKTALRAGAGGVVVFSGGETGEVDQIYIVATGRAPAAVTSGEPAKVLQAINAAGTAALFTHRLVGRRRLPGGTPPRFGLVALPEGTPTMIHGSAPAFSADGRSLAFISRTEPQTQLLVAPTNAPDRTTVVQTGPERLDAPALSHDGGRIVFQKMSNNDWELYLVNRDGSGEQRLTREIQHDVAPRFVTGDRVLGLVGEARHRRSYLYDVADGRRLRLFHNNTVRTIAPEYDWVFSPDGTRVVIVADRDGDAVSAERGVYLTDLTRRVTRDELRARLRTSLAAEQALRARGTRLFAPIARGVASVVAASSVSRVFGYEKALFDFDSKDISQPGNRKAATYLFDTYTSFGYQPEYQWLALTDALGGQTANVIATLKGTLNPELVYVVSSHYDSVAIGPGADDNSSGTAALLETARLLAEHPQPATIVFASFTGEEEGLLGSTEFVRRAVSGQVRIAGALNNDMVGWANDHRLDNTIRYSNPGIRDIQHAAAMQFSTLITYDALYYRNTDADAYYSAFGNIVGGLGSYPVLGSPHYHQPGDTLDTVNHQQVTEVARTTAASVMLLASSPSPLKNLKIDNYRDGSAAVSWTPAPERDITGYLVAWGPADAPDSQQLRVATTSAIVKVPPGTVVSVKAINQRGLEGWDWARVIVR